MGCRRIRQPIESSYLEALVLENALDGGILSAGRELGLEDDTERAIAHDLALGVLHLFRLTGQSILDLFANDFCRNCQRTVGCRVTSGCAVLISAGMGTMGCD